MPWLLRDAGHAGHRLAVGGLGVQPALSGYHQAAARELILEPHRLHDHLDAWQYRRSRKAMSPKPRPPAAPAPGLVLVTRSVMPGGHFR